MPLPSATGRPPDLQRPRDGLGRRCAHDPRSTISPPIELAKQMQKLGLDARARSPMPRERAKSAGGPTPRRISPTCVERTRAATPRRRSQSMRDTMRFGHRRRGRCRHEGRRHRHRHDPLRRHRRDRHVGHCRGDEEPSATACRARTSPRALCDRRAAPEGITVDDRPRARRIWAMRAVVVTSTAVRRTNPEVVAALERRVPVVRRAEMLAELMRLEVDRRGRRARTARPPPPSMIAALLDAGGVDPTVINGGIIERLRLQRPPRRQPTGWWSRRMRAMVASSSSTARSRWSPISIPSISIITARFEQVKEAFVEFIENVPFYGARFALHRSSRGAGTDRRRCATGGCMTYGFSAQADIRGDDVTAMPTAAIAFDAVGSASATVASADRGHRAADAGPAQCPERARRGRAWRRDGLADEVIRTRLRAASAGSSGALPGSASRRRRR